MPRPLIRPWSLTRAAIAGTSRSRDLVITRTVEAAVRRALARGADVTVQRTLEMLEIMIAELVRED